ncbi:DHHC zinc finger domain containing protein [Histomonas meleagridis]|uniref:DHHC zinc finger domain containing protein n=1 Tax=Histomonas meleagridis TaxID=135588 RepID=UPI0035598B55|nr:DHHC zinc finger domain containing protein [Histomonas meleagridis]KAH0799368.1 DHHC zinc finger domain containing protein [Histomonas meleagridis]
MNRGDCILSIITNSIVIAIGLGFAYSSLIVSIPSFKSEDNKFFINTLWCITAFFFIMWIWCWIYSATADPGRTSDDLKDRGYLQEIQKGNIPIPLRGLPICHKCGLPQPPNAEHCDICNSCHLRFDHHCGVIGNCVADKNLKSFTLSFIYGGIFSAITTIVGLISFSKLNKEKKGNPSVIIGLIITVYSGAISIVLIAFGLGIFFENLSHSKLSLTKYLWTFGNHWWQKLIPIQRKTTFLAWPGVFWVDDFEA